MSSEDITGGQNGLNSQLVLEDDPMRFNCGHPQRRLGEPPPKTRDLIDPKLFSSDHRFFPSFHAHSHIYRPHPNPTPHWDSNDNEATSADDDSDPDDDDDDDDATGDSDPSNHQLPVALHKPANNTPHNSNNCNNISTTAAPNHTGHRNGNTKHLSSFGSNGEVMVIKDGGGGAVGQAANTTTTVPIDGDMYYSQYLQATEGSSGGGKNLSLENGCGFSGRKELSSFSSESGDSLRAILSDPVTGALMDDAMILPCGHSFGGGGVQHAIRMKACYTCSQPVTEESIAPNLSLQAAVQAFRREVELQFYRPSKRRRERFDQDKSHGDSYIMDPPRGRGVQFPFVVTDRVIIKGNKRTPQRFVGREAVVTTQCLNGWYVVKTLDNAESVKLQYRSLAKVSDDSSSKTMPNKMTPNWL